MSGGTGASERYTRIAIWLHWLVAAGIFVNLFLGFTMDILFEGSRGAVIAVHASIGLSVLALAVLRILWRLAHRPPEFDEGLAGWERLLATYGHFFLYLGMVLVPLSGWAILSTNPPADSPGAAAAKSLGVEAHPNHGIVVWGVVTVPVIAPINEIGRTPEGVRAQSQLHHKIEDLHGSGSWVLIALIVLHLLGAAKHQLLDGSNILARMGLPTRPRPTQTN